MTVVTIVCIKDEIIKKCL